MRGAMGSTRQTLKNLKYKEVDKTKRAIDEAIAMYGGLQPTQENFIFNNGSNKDLVCLKGTIPVNYRGTTYHFPITIWLLDTYPYNAPMVYVNPTPTMRIKASRHVDQAGKVYLPYLHDWKHHQSDLLCLIQVLIMTFGEQPPLYTVSQQSQQSQLPAVSPPYPQQPYGTPYPMGTPAMPMPAMANPLSPPQPQIQSPASTVPFNVRPSLLSAAEEKLKRRLEDLYLSSEIVKKTGEQLQNGETKLKEMVKRLDDEKIILEQNIDQCQRECTTLDEKIAKSTPGENDTNIDDAIQVPAPLYKQILNIVAEEAALEDTIYYLGEALRCEKMDLDLYLRSVRQVSRRQFVQRALLRKCRQKAGLAG